MFKCRSCNEIKSKKEFTNNLVRSFTEENCRDCCNLNNQLWYEEYVGKLKQRDERPNCPSM